MMYRVADILADILLNTKQWPFFTKRLIFVAENSIIFVQGYGFLEKLITTVFDICSAILKKASIGIHFAKFSGLIL